jgi:hypothetical protein
MPKVPIAFEIGDTTRGQVPRYSLQKISKNCALPSWGQLPTAIGGVGAPEHIHLLFLPAYSPELQPAEHLWPLTNTALDNQHFTSIEDLENAQTARCVVLQNQPDLVRSATCCAWWPRRLMRRRGPRPSTRG